MIDAKEILSAKILVAHYQESDACSLRNLIERAGHTNVSQTTNPYSVCALHRINSYRAILLDLQMPGMYGFQILKDLSAIEFDSYVPVIALSSEPTDKLTALKTGAKDFIGKPYDAEEALTQLRNMLQIRLLHEAARNAAVTHEILAQQDPLTGLGNRRYLTERVSAAVANARRNNSAMAVLYLDLDGFKQINDTLGHSAGDALLVLVAQRLKSLIREADTIARVGGDEFMIAMWQVSDENSVKAAAARLVELVAQSYFVAGTHVVVTSSVGVAIYPEHGEDGETLMKSADLALYEAKRAGKNAFRISHNSKKKALG